MKRTLLKLIICPECKKDLYINKTFKVESQEIIEGTLKCKSCQNWYPIIKAIPRLLPSNLRDHNLLTNNLRFLNEYRKELPTIKIITKKTKDIKNQTSEAFGYEWLNWPKPKKKHYNQFIHWTEPFKPAYFKNKIVLDAGCGTGNHANYITEWRAKTFAIDLSESITVAYYNRNLFKKNSHYIQADIYNLPFKPNFFDFIYSQGVLHHLPNPEKGFTKLLTHLKKSGVILTRIYNREDNFFMIYIIEGIFKKLIKNLPFKVINTIAYFQAATLYTIIHLIYKPVNKIKFLDKILPYFEYLNYLSNFSFYQIHSIVFDLLIAPLAFYYSKSELLNWYVKNKLKIISIQGYKEGAWRISGQKIN